MTQPCDYLVGIDLGTTHCAVAFADTKKPLDANNCTIFDIAQLIGPGEIAKRPLLPCFRYHPLAGEIKAEDRQLPFAHKFKRDIDQVIIGEWARTLGAKTHGRLVSSAKSWLCQKDAAEKSILPFNGQQDAETVSPVLAQASYLYHIKQAWNHEHPDSPLEKQDITLTIPASFDEAARQFTLAAAELAGLTNIFLIEEPQAVCYHFFAQHHQEQIEEKLLLVCDIGGGTTDLSLITMHSDNTKPLALKRIGVGDHLMLGGDNIDLFIAAQVNQQAGNNPSQRMRDTSQLIQQSRIAKESLFNASDDENIQVTLLGAGSKLIGQSKTITLDKAETTKAILDGFFPLKTLSEIPEQPQKTLETIGLPFESDPAITHHLARFILQHQKACQSAIATEGVVIPDALLLNGGIFKSATVTARMQDVIQEFSGKKVRLLDNDAPDLAVAFGAVAYALARRGIFEKIAGGSARSFFLLLKKADDQGSQKAICLLPKGTEENQPQTLDQDFLLSLGQQVRFDVLASNADQTFQTGELIDYSPAQIDALHLSPLPPLMMAIDDNDARQVNVKLKATYTDIGTLDIICQTESKETWTLGFSARNKHSSPSTHTSPGVLKAITLIDEVFGASSKQEKNQAIKSLRKQLEKAIGPRETWDIQTARALFDALLERAKRRRRSAQHERLWFNLAGFCLRPGFGAPDDDQRIDKLWPLYAQGLQYKQDTQSYIDWWTCWRRASGGLNGEQQAQVFDDIALYFSEKALKSSKLQQQAKFFAIDDMIKLAASLERLPQTTKTNLIQQLLARLKKNTNQPNLWWALGRIGSRQPAYAQSSPLSTDLIQPIIDQALNTTFEKNLQVAFAAVLIGQKTSDSNINISTILREKIADKLKASKQPPKWLAMLENPTVLDEQDKKRLFGEALPQGISLA